MSKQILYIDAHLFNQLLVKRILQKDGHEVHGCASLREGQSYASTYHPDLILLDLQLEGQPAGLEWIATLRQTATFGGCPIMVLTSCGRTETEIAALAAGANGFIYKPASIRDIQTALRAILTPVARVNPAPTPFFTPALAL